MRTTMKTLAIAACSILFSMQLLAQQTAKTLSYSSAPGGIIGFLEFKPSDYGTQKHPLIIFLHGIGERGNGTTQINTVANNGIPYYCANGATMRFTVAGQTSSFVVLSPQLSTTYGYWPTFYAKEMIKYAKANLQIDTNRIYVTGLSLGGGGIWRLITDAQGFDYTYDKGLAAAAPICGTQEETDADFYGTIGANHLPVWAFHSMDDGVVGVGATQHAEILGNIVGVNSPAIKFTYYQSGNHSGAWVNAYDTGHITRTVNVNGSLQSFTANPNLYEWFLSNTRAVNTPPVALAGAAQSITLPSTTATLNGSGTPTNGASIATYAWTKTSGPAGGTITTANAATTTVTGLSQGVYVFTLTVTDNHGLSASSTVTITVVPAPVAIAGPPQTISTTSTVLDAAASYSPNGSITAYSWTQVAGPAAATIANPSSATPIVSNMLAGSSYSFQLTVTDVLGASGSAVTGVTVTMAALPVEFAYFNAQKNTAGNLLQWGTATELNNDYFVVERSEDGSHFASIGKVAGAGSSTMPHSYSFTDSKSLAATNYYRLKQVDKNGSFTLSKVITVRNDNYTGGSLVYPNPVLASMSVTIDNEVKGKGQIAVYDVMGHTVKQASLSKSERLLSTSIAMNDLVPGIYMVEVKIGDAFRITKRVMKQ
ncbi:MAG TPA: T9SS type A sorting domain-containing protein [Chitinophagaceae bacterium]|nr:T9SS type A sorting domain-containing protein [Chitinophagaceae bacterium]